MFIPIDKSSNSNGGFAFVRFATLREAEKAVKLAEGKHVKWAVLEHILYELLPKDFYKIKKIKFFYEV